MDNKLPGSSNKYKVFLNIFLLKKRNRIFYFLKVFSKKMSLRVSIKGIFTNLKHHGSFIVSLLHCIIKFQAPENHLFQNNYPLEV